MPYEVVSTVVVSVKNGRIVIEVQRSDDNPPFIFTLSPGSAANLAYAITRKLKEAT